MKAFRLAAAGAVSLLLLVGCSSGSPAPTTATVEPTGGDSVAAALQAEGAQVNLYWPTNDVFTKFINDQIIPGFVAKLKAEYGVDATVNVLDAAGGDGAFLDRLKANGGKDGFGIDVARTAPSASLLDAIDTGLLTDLSGELVPNLADVDPAGLDIFTVDGAAYGAPIYKPTMSLFFRTSAAATPPASLEDILEWAKQNPGKFTYEDPQANTSSGSGTMFLLAVMNKFGDVKDSSTWGPGWDYLRELQKYSAPQPTAGAQLLDQFQRGEVHMFPFWNDGGLFAKADMKLDDMANVLLDSGFPVRYTPYVVPKGAAHPTAAKLFTDWVLGPEVQTGFATVLHQIPSSQAAAVADAITDDTFGFPLADIAAKNFPAYNSREALVAVGELTNAWSEEVIGRG